MLFPLLSIELMGLLVFGTPVLPSCAGRRPSGLVKVPLARKNLPQEVWDDRILSKACFGVAAAVPAA